MKRTGFLVCLLLLGLLAACGTPGTTTGNTGSTATGNTGGAGATTGATAPSTDSTVIGGADTSLDAIKQRGKLVVGVKYDVVTFGYLNPETNKVEGFDVEMAKAVAQRIFGNPDAVEFKEAISKNRIPYLNEGVVDVVFSTMTANEERAQQIDFSDCYYVAGQSLLVPIDSTLTGVNDLGGKRVATVTGSTSEKNVRAAAPTADVKLFSTYSEAVQAMQSGQADAVTTDDIILFGFVKNSPDKFKVVGGQFTQEPYAAGVKKGNTALVEEVNAAIRDLKQNGRWAEIYKQTISPENVPPVPPQNWQDVVKKS